MQTVVSAALGERMPGTVALAEMLRRRLLLRLCFSAVPATCPGFSTPGAQCHPPAAVGRFPGSPHREGHYDPADHGEIDALGDVVRRYRVVLTVAGHYASDPAPRFGLFRGRRLGETDQTVG